VLGLQGVSSMAKHVRGLEGTDTGATATEPYRVFLWVMLHRMEQSLRCCNKKLRAYAPLPPALTGTGNTVRSFYYARTTVRSPNKTQPQSPALTSD
jgi:hypothetical protein